MDNFIVRGGRPLYGQAKISGSKNAALPILAATLLTREKCEIKNVPELMDIKSTFELLNYLGKNCFYGYGNFVAEEHGALKLHAPYDLVRKMRASMLVSGPLLARFKKVRFPDSAGFGINPNNAANQPEFFTGLAVALNRFMLHTGVHWGRRQFIGGGYFLNGPAPSSGSVPIGWAYRPAFSIGFSVRVAPY